MIVAAINCILSRKKNSAELSHHDVESYVFLFCAKQVLSTSAIRRADQRKEGLVPLLRAVLMMGMTLSTTIQSKTTKFRSLLYFDSRRWRKTSDSLSWLRSWLAKSFPQYLLSLVGSAAAFHLTNQLSTTDCFYKDWLVPHSSSLLHKSSDSVTLDSIF